MEFQLGDRKLRVETVKGNFSKNSPINDIFVGFETPETFVGVHLRPKGIASLVFSLRQNGIGDFSPFEPMAGYDFQGKRYPPMVPREEIEGLKQKLEEQVFGRIRELVNAVGDPAQKSGLKSSFRVILPETFPVEK